MTALEVVLIICGIICVVVSFIMGNGGESTEPQTVSVELTEKQKESIKEQVNAAVMEELELLNEQTEVTLDKISNTKIMEMNEFAETILKEIDRNHNETVFLYDMLNEKAKEVKSTVKDVNVTKKQVQKMHAEVTATDDVMTDRDKDDDQKAAEAIGLLTGSLTNDSTDKKAETPKKTETLKKQENADGSKTAVKKTAKPRKVKKQIDQELAEDVSGINIQFEKGPNNNEKVLKLFNEGKSNKDIAKELNLGVGEVKLVIDLYNSGK